MAIIVQWNMQYIGIADDNAIIERALNSGNRFDLSKMLQKTAYFFNTHTRKT